MLSESYSTYWERYRELQEQAQLRGAAEFKRAAKILVKTRDAKGMLRLLEERTDMHYEDFEAGSNARDGQATDRGNGKD